MLRIVAPKNLGVFTRRECLGQWLCFVWQLLEQLHGRRCRQRRNWRHSLRHRRKKNRDQHPILTPINSFDAGIWEWNSYYVDVISNSTVSDFHFNPDDALIRFNVSGTNNTTGYCRVTIPKGLLYSENGWQVTINGEPVTPTIDEDAENTNLYFNYNHSTKTVEIMGTDAIPEFPSGTPMLLILAVLAVVLTIYKRKLQKASIQSNQE